MILEVCGNITYLLKNCKNVGKFFSIKNFITWSLLDDFGLCTYYVLLSMFMFKDQLKLNTTAFF